MSELLEVIQLERVPVAVEAVKWDGSAEGAAPILAWIRGKGESAILLREGDISTHQPHGVTKPVRWKKNYIAVSTRPGGEAYLNASPEHCWIVWDRDNSTRGWEEGDFIAIEPDYLADKYRRTA